MIKQSIVATDMIKNSLKFGLFLQAAKSGQKTYVNI